MKALTISAFELGAVVHIEPQTVSTNNLQNSIAYRSAALERMTQEASWACIKLRLISQPFQPPEITSFFIVPPRKMGFSGTANHQLLFPFGIHGKLDRISDQRITLNALTFIPFGPRCRPW